MAGLLAAMNWSKVRGGRPVRSRTSRPAAEAYSVPVFQLTTVLATTSKVHGVEFGADTRLAQLTDAWVSR